VGITDVDGTIAPVGVAPAVLVLVAVLEEDEDEDEGLSLLPTQEAKITSKTTAPIPSPIFCPPDMPGFAD